MKPLACVLSICVGLVSVSASADEAKPDAHGYVSLFDGKSLDGWEQKNGTAKYEIKDEAILGSTAEKSPNSFLCTTKDYGDFDLVFEVKLLRDDLNSGVQIRSHSTPEHDKGRVHGPQVEIESAPGQAGYIYGEATTRKWISPDADTKPTELFKNGEWNKYRVRAVGPRVQVWINGEQVTDVSSPDNNPDKPGFISLQVRSYKGEHPGQVMWRNIRIKELKGSDATN